VILGIRQVRRLADPPDLFGVLLAVPVGHGLVRRVRDQEQKTITL
jgi:hypothetical protein